MYMCIYTMYKCSYRIHVSFLIIYTVRTHARYSCRGPWEVHPAGHQGTECAGADRHTAEDTARYEDWLGYCNAYACDIYYVICCVLNAYLSLYTCICTLYDIHACIPCILYIKINFIIYIYLTYIRTHSYTCKLTPQRSGSWPGYMWTRRTTRCSACHLHQGTRAL